MESCSFSFAVKRIARWTFDVMIVLTLIFLSFFFVTPVIIYWLFFTGGIFIWIFLMEDDNLKRFWPLINMHLILLAQAALLALHYDGISYGGFLDKLFPGSVTTSLAMTFACIALELGGLRNRLKKAKAVQVLFSVPILMGVLILFLFFTPVPVYWVLFTASISAWIILTRNQDIQRVARVLLHVFLLILVQIICLALYYFGVSYGEIIDKLFPENIITSLAVTLTCFFVEIRGLEDDIKECIALYEKPIH